MTERAKRQVDISAAELMAQLAGDEHHISQSAAAQLKRDVRTQQLHDAEQPIVRQLRGLGLDIASVWDLVNTSEPYPEALPVLLRHLERGGYPDRVMESLGRAMAVRASSFAWASLRDVYLAAQGPGDEEGLAAALAAAATASHMDDLLALVADESRGQTRLHFLGAIKRVGGSRGRDVLESLRGDPLFGAEAENLLRRR